MRPPHIPRPSAAGVVALAALTLTMTGTSQADLAKQQTQALLAQLKGRIGSAQLKPNSVTPAKIAPATEKVLEGDPGPRGAAGTAGPRARRATAATPA